MSDSTFLPTPDRSPADALPEWLGGARSVVAILVIDLVESTRLIGDNPDDVIARWQQLVHDVQVQAETVNGGKLVRSMGDGLLLTFPSALEAVKCAFHVQRNMPGCNTGRTIAESMYLRIAVHVDSVLFDRTEIHGLGVALATRLLNVALPGDVVCSTEARDQIVDGIDADFEDLGLCFLKHLPSAIRVYRLREARRDSGLARFKPGVEAPALDLEELRLSIAVLPFETHADSPEGAVIGDLIADQIIASLSRGSHLRVVSRLSSRAVLAHGFSTAEIARRLRVAYVVSGRMVLSGKRVSLVVELSAASTDAVIWADRSTATVDQLLSADDELAPRFAAEICSQILNEQLVSVRQSPLPTLQSYSLLLGGVSLMHRFTARDFARAKECLEALIERAPRHAEPYAWSARWHVFRAVQGWSSDPKDDRARAQDLCRRALDHDPESPLALTVAGSAEIALSRDIDKAQSFYQEALRVDPNEPLAWALLGTSHSFKGEGSEAVRCCSRACVLTPLDPMRFFYDNHLAAAAVAAGDYEAAIDLSSRSLRANRMHHSTLRTLAIAQSLAGQEHAARTTVQLILQAQPDLTVTSFLRNFPGSDNEHGRRVSSALRNAGLPA